MSPDEYRTSHEMAPNKTHDLAEPKRAAPKRRTAEASAWSESSCAAGKTVTYAKTVTARTCKMAGNAQQIAAYGASLHSFMYTKYFSPNRDLSTARRATLGPCRSNFNISARVTMVKFT